YATGWLGREMMRCGLSVITQKMIQTGNLDMSEDILRHREIMGIELQTVDRLHITAPIIYTYPASPHLAAAIDGKSTDLSVIDSATESLAKQYAHVLVEGAGGLMVPITEDYLTADYLHDRQLPTIVVINGQLGSINHALLTLHALKTYHVPLFGVIYNPYFDKDPIICADTKRYLREWLSINFENAVWLEMPMKV
ncbi:MAG: dethiobiotin synthase, partial [Muribaculaceae bacterium]|nr:dethiobiotin synthase [Muribaculaceae bacterium]